MSDATGKIIGSMFLNGVIHTILPALGIAGYMKLAEAPNLQSTNAFLTVLIFIVLGSFIANLISFMIVQSSVCGKVFQSEHIASLAGYGVLISIIFFSLSWHVGFVGNIIRDTLKGSQEEEENSEPDQFVESIVHAFYMFWAGMYSAASLSWFATACPLPTV
jgi:hypothetical protein